MPYQDDNGPPMFTYAMLAAYVGIFAAQVEGADSISHLHAFAWRLGSGQTWRLLTSCLLHGSVIHLAFNAVWFYRFSRVIENWLGPWVALLLFAFFCGGSMAFESLILRPTLFPPIGASGGVYGLFGFLWVLRRRRDDAAEAVPVNVSQTMLGWLVLCVVVNYFGGNIANGAHVVGLLLGWGLGRACVATKKWRVPIFAGTLAAGLLLILLTFAPVWKSTLGRMPVLAARYQPELLPPVLWQKVEHPAEEHRPGLFM